MVVEHDKTIKKAQGDVSDTEGQARSALSKMYSPNDSLLLNEKVNHNKER